MRRRARVAVLVAALAIIGSTGLTAADAAHEHGQLDVTALAIASEADRTSAEDAFDVARLNGPLVDSNVVGASNSTCDGCSSRATALGVVYVKHGGRIVVDNLATAASSGCTECSSVAVSAQVVVLRRPEVIVANNRSLAVNAACISCTTSAVAYQFVVVAPKAGNLTGDDLVVLRAWVRAQADALTRGVGASLRSSAGSAGSGGAAATVEKELRERLGPGATVTTKVDVRQG